MAKSKRASRKEIAAFACVDCGINTLYSLEYYMVHDALWEEASLSNLCIGCLEGRLGFTLCPEDFIDAPVNTEFPFPKSERLKNRLGL